MRRVIGKMRSDKMRNERVRKEAGQEKPIMIAIEEKQLKWLGHIQRMSNNRKEKMVAEMAVEGKNPRGRPSTIVLDKLGIGKTKMKKE